jgi:hypothetical protein
MAKNSIKGAYKCKKFSFANRIAQNLNESNVILKRVTSIHNTICKKVVNELRRRKEHPMGSSMNMENTNGVVCAV